MLRIISLIALIPLFSTAQLNMQQLGYLDLVSSHNSDLSDIWGYADGNGNEYAIVGTNDGTSVVDVTNPANPVEVFYQPGLNNFWRDIKTWNNHAYITTEEVEGLLIIDLSTLPGNTNLATNYYTGPTGSSWGKSHNLYIDENGICYIFGADRGNGGAIMLDLTIDPMNPVEIGVVDMWYTHDGVARGDTLYMAHISDGFFSIWDVANKSNPVLLGQHATTGNTAHNLWISNDGNYIYTTDEISDGFIGEFDISDPSNIIELGKIQSNPGMNVIPHNTHYINDYVVTSYYRDGVVIHDVSNKGNMVEVGNFDTSPTFSGDGFNGCWGVYPFLPSGNILATDIENGLYILGANYTRGCYLEGVVTDFNTTAPINGVNIELVTTSVFNQSVITGNYATGYSTAGAYDVIYSHPAYISDTIYGVALVNGQTTLQDVQLIPIPNYDLVVHVDELLNIGTNIANALVSIENNDFVFTGFTDVNGIVTFFNFYEGTYSVNIGKWGYLEACQSSFTFGANDTLYSASLETGYGDLFNLNFGWQVSGAAIDGVWERGVPVGTFIGGSPINPDNDVADCGNFAYVTGNGGGSAGTDDVDGADAILTSPIMDLTGYSAPKISLEYWWRNIGGQVFPNDSLSFVIDDGTNQYTVAEFYQSDDASSWRALSFYVADYTTSLASIQLIVKTADWSSQGGNLVEAGVDNFLVSDGVFVEELLEIPSFSVYPNPSNASFNLAFNEKAPDLLDVFVYDIFGKLISTTSVQKQNATITIATAGVYTIVVRGKDYNLSPQKVIKL